MSNKKSKHSSTQSSPAPLAAVKTPKTQASDAWTVYAWSKAGVSTTVVLREKLAMHRRTIMFDCGGLGGVAPSLVSSAELVFISHTHADHCGGLFSHARSRFAQQTVARYFVPEESLAQLKEMQQRFSELDGHELKMEFVPVCAGFKCALGHNLFLECVATEHRVPSLGFLLFRDQVRIRPEHVNCTGEEKARLGKLKKLNEHVRILEVSYSGDTTTRGLDSRLFQSQLAIVECTFVEEKERQLAIDTQHVLLSDLKEFLLGGVAVNPECQLLLMHFSARYNARMITEAVRRAELPFNKPIALALAGFVFDPLAKEEDVGLRYAV